MYRPQPIDKETSFNFSEIFFSRTNSKGVIDSYNRTFEKISEHPGSELLNSPHNIVRHPDTPRGVFKLMWENIQAGKPVATYVKNLSKSGSYYWVYALVLPIEKGYLSLRLKPSSAIFDKIPSLFRKMCEIEKSSDLSKSTALLHDAISEFGFNKYSSFMTRALTEELTGRDEKLKQSGRLTEASSLTSRSQVAMKRAFYDLSLSSQQIEAIHQHSLVITRSFAELGFLSINMATASEHAGIRGQAMSEVTIGFSMVAKEIQEQIKLFDDRLTSLLESVEQSQFDLGCARLQIEMMTDFIKESEFSTDAEKAQSHQEDLFLLNKLTNDSIERTITRVNSLRQLFSYFLRTLEELLKTVNGMELIRITGKIEVAKIGGEHGVAFQNHIDDMAEFLKKLAGPMRTSSECSRIGYEATASCYDALILTRQNLPNLKNLQKNSRHSANANLG
jgi:PAS fold